MERMGPEALLVRYQTDVRIDLAEFARQEFYREDPLQVEGAVRNELDHHRVDRAGPGILARWARAWRHRAPARAPAMPLARPVGAADRCLAGTTLAAMPASMAPLRPER